MIFRRQNHLDNFLNHRVRNRDFVEPGCGKIGAAGFVLLATGVINHIVITKGEQDGIPVVNIVFDLKEFARHMLKMAQGMVMPAVFRIAGFYLAPEFGAWMGIVRVFSGKFEKLFP
jgi:hypothetical protein